MIRRIDHVSVAVHDLTKAKAFFEQVLGAREVFSAPMEGQGFRWTTLELGSSCLLELIDPIGADGFLQRFLAQRGEGVHHITVQVDDAREAEVRLQGMGVPTFGYNDSIPGWKEFFIHPKAAFGTLIQFAEFNPLDWIYPGYVPKSYAEFAPPPPVAAEVLPEEGTPALRRRKDQVRRFYEAVWNAHDNAAIPELLHENIAFRGSLGEEKSGHDGVAEYVDRVHAALGDYRCCVQDLVAEGDKVCARVQFDGIHRAELLGHPPSGKRVSWNGCALFTFAGDRIADIWVMGDRKGLEEQLQQSP